MLENLVSDLLRGDYKRLAVDGRIGRLTMRELQKALADFPGRLSVPPRTALEGAHYYPAKGSGPAEGIVELDLWYDDKPSDLTLTAQFETKGNEVKIRILDVHVL
jgi:hypothetical protein